MSDQDRHAEFALVALAVLLEKVRPGVSEEWRKEVANDATALADLMLERYRDRWAPADQERATESPPTPERIIFNISSDLAVWLDEEWHRRRLPSRAETIRAILSEARGKP